MKLIPLSFQSNIDKCGICTFSFVKKDDSTNVMIYKRVNNETQAIAYEVFIAKIVKAGAPLPNGTVVAEDYEQYPGSNAFGKTAYFCSSMERAELRFDELIQRVKNNRSETTEDSPDQPVIAKKPTGTGKRGRKKVVRPQVVTPTSGKWTMKELLKLNPSYSQPILYLHLTQHPENYKKVGFIPAKKGKPATLWSLV